MFFVWAGNRVWDADHLYRRVSFLTGFTSHRFLVSLKLLDHNRTVSAIALHHVLVGGMGWFRCLLFPFYQWNAEEQENMFTTAHPYNWATWSWCVVRVPSPRAAASWSCIRAFLFVWFDASNQQNHSILQQGQPQPRSTICAGRGKGEDHFQRLLATGSVFGSVGIICAHYTKNSTRPHWFGFNPGRSINKIWTEIILKEERTELCLLAPRVAVVECSGARSHIVQWSLMFKYLMHSPKPSAKCVLRRDFSWRTPSFFDHTRTLCIDETNTELVVLVIWCNVSDNENPNIM